MSEPRYRVDNANQVSGVMGTIANMVHRGLPAGSVEIKLGRPGKRSLSQNAKMWPMLTDVSTQVNWYGETLTPEDWKDVLTASLRKQKAVPGIDGGFVVLGMRTSKMRKKEFSNLIELIYAFGADQGVLWSEKALAAYEQYREAQQ